MMAVESPAVVRREAEYPLGLLDRNESDDR
jgi:hypothetical protein